MHIEIQSTDAKLSGEQSVALAQRVRTAFSGLARQIVRIVVRVDAEGKVERCGYLEKSASQALSDSVCSAVMKTADLGKPPYGMSQDVYLTFWQGGMADQGGGVGLLGLRGGAAQQGQERQQRFLVHGVLDEWLNKPPHARKRY